MNIVRFALGSVPSLPAKTVLCLGTFDGVHRGHQALLAKAREASEGNVAVLLFDANPADFLQNGKSHAILTPLDDKLALLTSYGADMVAVIHVDKELFGLSPIEFVTQVLKKLAPSALAVGPDYTFGVKGSGTVKDLQKDFPVVTIPLLKDGAAKISTQAIIRELEDGDIEKANRALGRPYEIKGLVGHGLQNGRKLGFPTANLVMKDPYVLPKDGVYLGLAYSRGRPYKALINVGNNPTIGVLSKPVVESFLEGLGHDIYDETLYVDFTNYLREEKKFASFEDLKEQIEKDKDSLH